MVEESGDGFLSRWARRKGQVRSGVAVAPEPARVAVVVEAPVAKVVSSAAAPVVVAEDAPVAEPPPTLADVALLTRESDYSRFVATGVDDGVKQAAMKKLFTDPHFNVMDGLDIYIDDYSRPDPIPLAMLRQMNQSKVLRLFEHEEDEEDTPQIARSANAVAAETHTQAAPEALSDLSLIATDDHADLRLQQDDAARQPGPDQGPRA